MEPRRLGWACILCLALALIQGCGGGGGSGGTGNEHGGGSASVIATLTPGTSWNWQIDGGTIDQTVLDGVANSKKMYDIDLEKTSAVTISQLKAKGIYVVCYTEVGSYNEVRADASRFTAVPGLIGKPMAGYPSESWVDVRRTDALMPIMNARLDQAQSKGCQGIEPDLDDSYTQDTGFPLTPAATSISPTRGRLNSSGQDARIVDQ